MSKILHLLIAAAFVTGSAGSFAASHGGAAKGEMKMEEKKEMMEEKKEMMEEKKEMMEEKKGEHKEMMEEKKEEKKPAK